MHISFKKAVPHLVVILLLMSTSLLYFSPVLSGKTIFQSDIVQHNGMAKELRDFRKTNDTETYWTDSAFGGMPTYQLGARYPHNYIKTLDESLRFLPRPADYLFLYFIGIYVLFLVLKLDYKIAFLGALAFGFSTYLIIILGVGHNAKAHAIAYMPLVLSGIILTFRGKYLWGFLLTTIAMGLELTANHIQMTYYLLLLVVCLGVSYLIDAVKKKTLPHFFTSVGIMILGVLLALGLNATNLLATKEYADTSTRAKSDLTINPDGTPKLDKEGLDYDYITTYSYGMLETFNLLVPRFMGGGSSEPFPEDAATQDALLKMGATPQQAKDTLNQIPLYWGDQPIVAAPAYVGAVVIFLAILGLFLIQGRLKWWLVSGFILSLLLSWGKNFSLLTDFFIDYVPLYNKFRAVSSIQVIIELVLPVLAMVGLHQFFKTHISEEKKRKSLVYATSLLGGLLVLFLLFKNTLFNFVSPYDSDIIEAMGVPFIDAVREDRMTLFTNDGIRSLVFIVLSAITLWLFLTKKYKETFTICILTILVVFDLVGVDRRYVNNEDFVNKRIMEQPFQKSAATLQIEKQTGRFRVYDAANNAFNSAEVSYFNSSIGGYHAAKPRRMQDIADFYINQGDISMLNMMNARFIIVQSKNGGLYGQRNPYANGNAWFVQNVILAETADEEIIALDSLDTKKTVVVHKDFISYLPLKDIKRDSTATIELVYDTPNHLVYEAATESTQLAVFSEVYYSKGWNAYINGEPVEHIRVNYLLRALKVSKGYSKIEFKFEPSVVKKGSFIALFSSVLFILFLLGTFGYYYTQRRTSNI
tara:strand:+ start:14712 stop:17150 length:2439 start_codon:yes stop_codon:yes gene_type:complete